MFDEPITDEQINEFVSSGLKRQAFDKNQAQAFVSALIRRIVGEQVTAIEYLGGLGSWSRDSLSSLLSNTAEIELTQIFGSLTRTFESKMAVR